MSRGASSRPRDRRKPRKSRSFRGFAFTMEAGQFTSASSENHSAGTSAGAPLSLIKTPEISPAWYGLHSGQRHGRRRGLHRSSALASVSPVFHPSPASEGNPPVRKPLRVHCVGG